MTLFCYIDTKSRRDCVISGFQHFLLVSGHRILSMPVLFLIFLARFFAAQDSNISLLKVFMRENTERK